MKKAILVVLILSLMQMPGYSVEPTRTANSEVAVGALRSELRSSFEASNPFLRGVLPEAELLQSVRINTEATNSIAAGLFALNLVGSGDRDTLDAAAQDIFVQVHKKGGLNLRILWFEGAKHAAYGDDVEFGIFEGGQTISFQGITETSTILADVTENTSAMTAGKIDESGSGGSSLYLTGKLVEAFGAGQDELGAALIIGGVPLEKMNSFLPTQGGQPLDPDNSVIENIDRLLEANGLSWNDAQVFIMNRKRAESEYLAPLREQQQKFPGLVVSLIKNGSYEPALLATLGRKEAKYPVFVGTSGSTEAAANYLQALVTDGAVAGFRLYSPFSKNVADAIGSMSKTIAELTPEEISKAKTAGKIPDEVFNSLPKDVPVKYLFTKDRKEKVRAMRSEDGNEITSPQGKLFHNETLTYPRTPEDVPGIRLHNEKGEVIKLIDGLKWNDTILSASTTTILAGTILNVSAPKEVAPGEYLIWHTVVERSGGKTFVWNQPNIISWEDLARLSHRLFAGSAPEIKTTERSETRASNVTINSLKVPRTIPVREHFAKLPLGIWMRLLNLLDEKGKAKILALDQSGSMKKLLREQHKNAGSDFDQLPKEQQDKELIELKLLLSRVLSAQASAVLHDVQHGIAVAGLFPGGISFGASLIGRIEKSVDPGKAALTEPGWSVKDLVIKANGQGAKILVYLDLPLSEEEAKANPERVRIAQEQLDYMKKIYRETRRYQIPLLAEELVYERPGEKKGTLEYERRKAETVILAARLMSPMADILKLEFPGDFKTMSEEEILGYLERLKETAKRPWVLLSAGEDYETFRRKAESAMRYGGALGVMSGRAYFKEISNFQTPQDQEKFLRETAVARMQEINQLVDQYALSIWETTGVAPQSQYQRAFGDYAPGWHSKGSKAQKPKEEIPSPEGKIGEGPENPYRSEAPVEKPLAIFIGGNINQQLKIKIRARADVAEIKPEQVQDLASEVARIVKETSRPVILVYDVENAPSFLMDYGLGAAVNALNETGKQINHYAYSGYLLQDNQWPEDVNREIEEQLDRYFPKAAPDSPRSEARNNPLIQAVELRTKSMERHYFFGGNWKKRTDITTSEQARAKAREFRDKFQGLPDALRAAGIGLTPEVVIFPDAPWVGIIAEELKGSNISVGVQSLWFNPEGNLQEQINRAVEAGATFANVGHSMHRDKGKGIKDEALNKIMKALLADGRLIPWYTVEESGEDVRGRTPQQEIDEAIDFGLAGIPAEILATFPTTLEPTVLISTKSGTGIVDKTLQVSPEDARTRTTSVREAFRKRFGDALADNSNVGYGASVNPSNALGIFAERTVKNALIGGASLKADDYFNTVLNAMHGAKEAARARVAINGAGRIGVSLLRAWLQNPEDFGRIQIVAINDVAFNFKKFGDKGLADFVWLLKNEFATAPRSKVQNAVFDSGVDQSERWISINGKRIVVTDEPKPENLPWSQSALNVDVVLEATGVFTKAEDAQKHLQAGAKRVIITAPATGTVQAILPGINQEKFNPDQLMTSCASCTTNAIAPPLKILLNQFGIEQFYVSTTHAYTNDQTSLDTLRPGAPLRGRAAAENIIPTTTGAASAIGEVIPELKGKGNGIALRVPVPEGSIAGITAVVSKPTTKERVNGLLEEYARTSLRGIMEFTDEDLVSRDIQGRTASSIIAGKLTHVSQDGKLVTVWAWYPNEFGYPNRVLDLVNFISQQPTPSTQRAEARAVSIPAEVKSALEAQLPQITEAIQRHRAEARKQTVVVETVITPLDVETKAGIQQTLADISQVVSKDGVAQKLVANQGLFPTRGTVLDPALLMKEGYLVIALAFREIAGTAPVAVPLPLLDGTQASQQDHDATVNMLGEVNAYLEAQGKAKFIVTSTVSLAKDALEANGVSEFRAMTAVNSMLAEAIKRAIPDSQTVSRAHFQRLLSETGLDQYAQQLIGYFETARNAIARSA